MENIKYNPEIHCCEKWYKDFCNCRKEKTKHITYLSSWAMDLILKNNIQYEETKVKGLIILKNNAFLDLRMSNGSFMVRFNNIGQWYSFKKEKFIEKFS